MLLRLRLFVSSYMLLFVLLGIRFEGTWLRVACGVVAAVGLEEAWRVTRLAARGKTAYPYRVEAVEDAGGLVSGFLASYLLPFLASPRPTTADLVAYAVFFLVACLVALNSDLAHVNPTLYLLRRRVVRISTAGGSFILISKRTPRRGEEIMAARLAGGLVETENAGQ
jgi:hypothetical protein